MVTYQPILLSYSLEVSLEVVQEQQVEVEEPLLNQVVAI